MQLQSKNLNKVRVITLCYIEILLEVLFRIQFCIPALNLAGDNIFAWVNSIQSVINLQQIPIKCCEYLRSLRYKIRMAEIPFYEPDYIEGDNKSILANRTVPDSSLNKNNQIIYSHFVREEYTCAEWINDYGNTQQNEVYLLTKQLSLG